MCAVLYVDIAYGVKQVVGALVLSREEEGCFFANSLLFLPLVHGWLLVCDKIQIISRSKREAILRFKRVQQMPNLVAARVSYDCTSNTSYTW